MWNHSPKTILEVVWVPVLFSTLNQTLVFGYAFEENIEKPSDVVPPVGCWAIKHLFTEVVSADILPHILTENFVVPAGKT